MYYNTPYLSWQNGIERDDNNGVSRNATYLNTNDPNVAFVNKFYDWTAVHVDTNGVVISGTPQILAVDDDYLAPWRLALKIFPNRAEALKLSITGVAADGTTTAQLDSLTYIFHALFKSSEKISIRTSLETDGYPQSATPVITNFDVVDEYLTARSNFVELYPNNNKPSSSYTGSDITFTVNITITNHGGNGKIIYMTCPFLYQEYEYMQNPFVRNSTKYIPQVLFEIDQAQDPQYPMSKLMHALNYSSAQTSALTARFWKLDLAELPVQYDGTEDFSKSKLVDPNLADYEYLSWLAQFNGTSLRGNIYASNPADATQTQSLSVRAATTTNGALATAYAAGQTIDGITLIAGNRILIKNQSTASQNGVYIVNASGAPTRSADMPAGVLDISDGFSILVRDGTLNSGTIWRLTNAIDPFVDYSVGDIGPGGGKIFITPSTSGNSTGKYFEVAPIGAQVTTSWATGANQLLEVSGADGVAIGTGADNTADIVAQSGNIAATCAAVYCADLVFGGEADWFLPSKDELNEIYVNRAILGDDFTSYYYWNSTEDNSISGSAQYFVNGSQGGIGKNYDTFYVRPVRSFIQAVDSLTFGIKQISVVAATTVAGTLSTSFENGDIIDNVALVTNNKILIKDQASTSTNGVYVVNATGAPTRVATLPAALTLSNYLDVFVINGLTNKYKIFRSTSPSATIGTDSLTFSEVPLSAYETDFDEFARWQVSTGYWGYKAGTREAFDGILNRYLTGTKYRTYTLSGFLLSIKTLYDETPWAAYGRSPLLEALLEPARPAGYKLTVDVVHDLRFTFDSSTLGQFNDDPLG